MLEILLPLLFGVVAISTFDQIAPDSEASDNTPDDGASSPEEEPPTIIDMDELDSYSGGDQDDVIVVQAKTGASLFYDWDSYSQYPDESVLEIRGGGGDDLLELSGGGYRAFGDEGADRIEAGDASDIAIYGGLDDTIVGGTGEHVYVRLEGNALFEGGSGEDFVLSSSTSSVDLGSGDDVFIGLNEGGRSGAGATANIVYGGSGDDYLVGSMRESNLWSAHANDQGLVSHDSDILYGGAGSDTMIGSHGDVLFGGQGVDRFEVVLDLGGVARATLIEDFDSSKEQIEVRVGQGDGVEYSPEYFKNVAFTDFSQSVNADGDTVIEDAVGQELVRIVGVEDVRVGFESWDCDPSGKYLTDLHGNEVDRDSCDVVIRGQASRFF